MAKATWNSLVSLASSLLKKFGLTESDLYLHQDVTGKPCHKYFVDNPIEWANFKNEVKIKM